MSSIFVIGAGPGIGRAVALRFGREGMQVGLIARSAKSIEVVRTALADAGVQGVEARRADAGDEVALKSALDQLQAALGIPGVVVYNAAVVAPDTIHDLSHAERAARYTVNVLGALTTMTHLAPRMAEAGGGTILVTSGMPRPNRHVVSLSIDKAGLRAAAALVAGEYADQHVHVATVTVGGPVSPGSRFDPDEIADEYWRVHRQAPQEWSPDVLYRGNPDSPSAYRPSAP